MRFYWRLHFKGEGKEVFSKFYRENRNDIFRDKHGVEFPVFTDSNTIRQGVSVIIGHMIAGNRLDGFINHSQLHGEWIDGFDISVGDPAMVKELIRVLSYLRKSGLKTQLTTNGKNSTVLGNLLEKGLGDTVIMEVKGPSNLYPQLLGEEIEEPELLQSIKLTSQFPAYRYFTSVSPLTREDGTVSFLTPEEIGETAKMIEMTTQSKKHSFSLCACNVEGLNDKRLQSVELLPSESFFKYRKVARRYLVMTEIEGDR